MIRIIGYQQAIFILEPGSWLNKVIWAFPLTMGVAGGAIAATYNGVKFFQRIGWFPSARMEIPNFNINPESIFANKVPLLDIDIINPSSHAVTGEVQKTVSAWYNTFRNVAIVGLLSVLLYIGIRILIASASADKAKYKNMLKDWFIAFCLLFFMHYIMSFSITAVKFLTYEISKEKYNTGFVIRGKTKEGQEEPESFKKSAQDVYFIDEIFANLTENESELQKVFESKLDENGNLVLNYMELIRYGAQTSLYGASDSGEAFAYTIMYLVLVIYTVMFLFIYIKRLVYIILLTMIAPLVALSYPLDKMRDGSAQGFNVWLREYIFNLLIQPLHLILYYVLIETAVGLVADGYVLYPLIVMGFFLQAEKALRKLFGFDKSTTASSLFGGAMGGAAVMSGINWLSQRAKGIGKGGKSDSGKDNGVRTTDTLGDNRKPDDRYRNNDYFAAFSQEQGGSNSNPNGQATGGGNRSGNGNRSNANIHTRARADFSRLGSGDEYSSTYTPDINLSGFNIDNGQFSDYNGENENISFDQSADSGMPDGIRMPEGETPADNFETPDGIRMAADNNEGEEEDRYVDDSGLSFEERTNPEEDPGFWEGLADLQREYLPAKRVIKGVAKIGAGAIGAVTLGSIGLAAGLASDNFSNVAKFTLAGGVAGAGIGGKIGDAATDAPGALQQKYEKAEDIYKKGSLSKKAYQEWVNKKLDEKFKNNKEIRRKVEKEFGREKAEEVINDMMKYRQYGITDTDLIIKAMKTKIDTRGENKRFDERKVSAIKLSRHIKNEKGLRDLRKDMKDRNIQKDEVKGVSEFIRQIKDLDY